jgi:hypothetical protein
MMDTGPSGTRSCERDVALASNYYVMRKEAQRLLADIEAGREVDPRTITSMFDWKASVGFLSGLLRQRIENCNEELNHLGFE